ncbi:unnamed protein product [Brassica rapa]|uniref:GHMP kinase C-terminal domain-containing protein n=1 Tax=Brassica campestris TaxID=3711 RepID=A0A8D9I6E2_BRACM|nr:unnamed protein product [Brassica rapa]
MEPSFSNLKPKKQVKNKTENRIRVECPNGTVPILKNTKKYVANAQYWAERHFNPLTDESPGKHPNITAPATIAKPKNSLQDRVAQVYGGGLVHMVHSTVRRKWLDGDEFIISSMAEIAKLAEDGRTALLKIDYTKELMNRNFDLRRSMFGDECLGAMNIEMVEVARKVGAAAKFTGSGGAVVAFCPDGPSQIKLLEEECKKAGFVVEPVKLVPTRLNNSDLKTLSKP